MEPCRASIKRPLFEPRQAIRSVEFVLTILDGLPFGQEFANQVIEGFAIVFPLRLEALVCLLELVEGRRKIQDGWVGVRCVNVCLAARAFLYRSWRLNPVRMDDIFFRHAIGVIKQKSGTVNLRLAGNTIDKGRVDFPILRISTWHAGIITLLL